MDQKARALLDGQNLHWDTMYREDPSFFGEEPSESAQQAAALFKKEGKKNILELGGGQGRDALFFAREGFEVTVLDYSQAGVDGINEKAKSLGLSVTAIRHDARDPLPFAAGTFDGCYSNMFFCMAFTTHELERISREMNRVLSPGGLAVYTVRNTADPHYGAGVHHGEDLYEMGGFIVHFFSEEKVQQLAQGFAILETEPFEEDELPRRLYRVVERKL